MLSERQRAIVIGTLLGDGCLERNGHHVRLKVDHGEQQEDYVKWKFQELSNVAVSHPKMLEYFDRRTGQVYTHWRFATRSLKCFNMFRNLFYSSRGKGIPPNLAEYLNSSLALAVWYMDDGYRRRDCNALHLNTQGYTENEQHLLQDCLFRNFQISTKVHWARNYPKLYIPSNQARRFCEIVRPHMIPSMYRKLL